MKKYLKLIRVKHYIKNLLIFFPLVFSGNLFNINKLLITLSAFVIFSLSASMIYVINDIRDRDKDKLHEKKKNRPIASGEITVNKAWIVVFVLLFLSLVLNFCVNKNFNSYIFVLVYILINLAYSFGLKNIPLIDVAILVLGFLIRIIYGGYVIDVNVSNWLFLTVMSISFYLGLGKRRNEIIKVGKDSRKVLNYYNESFLDKNMYMFLAITIVFYSLWTVDINTISTLSKYLIWSIPLVVLILMRYSMNIENDSYGDPVEVVLNDKILTFMILLYGIIIMVLLYL